MGERGPGSVGFQVEGSEKKYWESGRVGEEKGNGSRAWGERGPKTQVLSGEGKVGDKTLRGF